MQWKANGKQHVLIFGAVDDFSAGRFSYEVYRERADGEPGLREAELTCRELVTFGVAAGTCTPDACGHQGHNGYCSCARACVAAGNCCANREAVCGK